MNDIANIVGVVIIPILFFAYTNYRNSHKALDEKINVLKDKVEEVKMQSATHPESFRRVHQRIESLEQNHDKLESAVEVRLDKFSDKLEKIYDILVERASGG